MGHDLTQGSLKSLMLPAIFQADDGGSIPLTRSSVSKAYKIARGSFSTPGGPPRFQVLTA